MINFIEYHKRAEKFYGKNLVLPIEPRRVLVNSDGCEYVEKGHKPGKGEIVFRVDIGPNGIYSLTEAMHDDDRAMISYLGNLQWEVYDCQDCAWTTFLDGTYIVYYNTAGGWDNGRTWNIMLRKDVKCIMECDIEARVSAIGELNNADWWVLLAYCAKGVPYRVRDYSWEVDLYKDTLLDAVYQRFSLCKHMLSKYMTDVCMMIKALESLSDAEVAEVMHLIYTLWHTDVLARESVKEWADNVVRFRELYIETCGYDPA